MSATYPVWDGRDWVDLPVAESGGEAVVVPNVAALVYRGNEQREILLQRRDKPREAVRGRLELPGGRWRAGESPDAALVREVEEESGVRLTSVGGAFTRPRLAEHVAFSIARPLAVVNGLEGAYPALHVLFECQGEGEPRAQPGETTDPRWWSLADAEAHLAAAPDDFVWHTRAMLHAAFGWSGA
ncbi:MAG: NUDIX domain-containing protein [Acidimicrobiia bacterium]|nr:NUDIX domain-containing protein [Acidimicrobiia bacterium]